MLYLSIYTARLHFAPDTPTSTGNLPRADQNSPTVSMAEQHGRGMAEQQEKPHIGLHVVGSVSFLVFTLVQSIITWQSMSLYFVQSTINPWYVYFSTDIAFHWLLQIHNFCCIKSIALPILYFLHINKTTQFSLLRSFVFLALFHCFLDLPLG